MREDDRPRHIRLLAPEFAVDEVRDPPEEEPERCDRGHEVTEVDEGLLVAPGIDAECGEHAEQAAVEGHSSLPDAEKNRGICPDRLELVEEEVADPSTQQHAEHQCDDEIPDQRRGQGGSALTGGAQHEPPGAHEPDHVGEAVIADSKRIRKAEQKRTEVVNPVGGGHRAPARANGWRRGACRGS